MLSMRGIPHHSVKGGRQYKNVGAGIESASHRSREVGMVPRFSSARASFRQVEIVPKVISDVSLRAKLSRPQCRRFNSLDDCAAEAPSLESCDTFNGRTGGRSNQVLQVGRVDVVFHDHLHRTEYGLD